jgi:hypothetical protein
VAGCCECGDEPSGSCTTELVRNQTKYQCGVSSSNDYVEKYKVCQFIIVVLGIYVKLINRNVSHPWM